MPTRNQTTVNQRGNPVANNPLMRKGGVHKKTRTSKRQKHKRETRRLVARYMGTARGGRRGDGGCYFSNRSSKSNSERSKRHEAQNFMSFFMPLIRIFKVHVRRENLSFSVK
ncbi:MAG: hypothetical protein KAG34_03825 [Cocleimonas sp.]|nr:hypothetical protein [Cocleimonas sp.]